MNIWDEDNLSRLHSLRSDGQLRWNISHILDPLLLSFNCHRLLVE